jgi:hypothetical protein
MTTATAPTFDELASELASMPNGTFLSHRSAAQLWGLWIPQFDAVEVTCPATERGSRYTTAVQRRRVITHRRITGLADVVEHLGLPVTSLGRTWLDLAGVLGIHDLIAAGDSALRAGASIDELTERTAAMRRLRGSLRARRAVSLLDADSRSRPESRIRAGLVLAGLPKPAVNKAIYDEYGQWLAEPDLHYKEAMLAIEYNGIVHATPERRHKDARRLLVVERADWTVRTYTTPDAFSRLDETVVDVHGLLLRRAPQLLARHHFRR